eukprot:scaffold8046_cov46-Cylindrotheca_fusiformis.AAC.2
MSVGDKDLVDKSQPELTILAPTRREKNKRATNEWTLVKWANVTWAKILGSSQEQGTRDVIAYALKFKEKDMEVTAGEECQHSCESVRVVPSSRGKAREIALGSHEMKKQSQEQL